MRRITLWALSTVSVLVLLFSYHTSTSSTLAASTMPLTSAQALAPTTKKTTSAGGTTTDGTTPDGTTTDGTTTNGTVSASQTFDGDAAMTRYGPVQVQVTVAGGTVTSAQTLQVPMEDRHDQQINSQAVPVYNGEVIDAQSAQIDVMSGATVTWEGYTQSLQSALDQAHL
ncbi:MAG: FMN-binding protein [Humibacillus sp.]|nr:FMN-binding protein [Humibacillus sp.]MDN5775519.1 FMN-binding protein [Humibacillus sp.]